MGWPNIFRRRGGATTTGCLAAIVIAGAFSAPLRATEAPAVDEPPTSADGTPRFEVDSLEFDLGELPKGEDGLARFTVRNPGDATLRILHVKPG